MKKIAIILLIFIFAFGSAFAGKIKYNKHDDELNYNYVVGDGRIAEIDDINIEIDDGSVILTNEYAGDDDIVEITEEYELYINDQKVKLTQAQQDIVKEFHVLIMDIVDQGKILGWEGAKIGLSGAKLGMKAVGRLFKMVFTDYDEDDFEYDMERDADKLEAQAEKLESKAKIIERMADDLKFVIEDLFDNVQELQELEWFE